MLHHRTPPRARAGAEAGSRGPCFTNLVFTVALSPRRRDAASFDSGPLFFSRWLTHSRYSTKAGERPCCRCTRCSSSSRRRNGRCGRCTNSTLQAAPQEKRPGDHRRGALPRCLDSVNRSRSFFLQLAVIRFTSTAYFVHAAHCAVEIRFFRSASSIKNSMSLQRERACFCSYRR